MSRILNWAAGHQEATQPNPPHQLKLPGMEQIGARSVQLHAQRHYIRFGQWPADERSRNHVTGWKEEGVSVYDAHPHTNEPMDPDPHWEHPGAEWAEDGMRNRTREFHQGKLQGFEVRGREVSQGHDGEPLLEHLHDVRDWDGGAKNRHRLHEERQADSW